MTAPIHDPDEALRLIRECYEQGGQPVTDAWLVEFLSTPINLGPPYRWDDRLSHLGEDGVLRQSTRRGPKSEKTQYDEHRRRWKGLYHKLIRLEANRPKAKAVRLSGGKPSRETVFALAAEAMKAGATKRQLRGKIKALAAIRGMTIPGDWQLGKLIVEFMKVDTTT